MATKRKRETEEDVMSSPTSKQDEVEVTRSGRVRKRPAKFVEDSLEEIDVAKSMEPGKVACSLARTLPAPVSPPLPQTPPKIVTIEVPVKEEEVEEDDDSGKTPGRSGRSRKKSAKVLEMEEFEEAEKKQLTKKEIAKKLKSPSSPVFLNQKTVQRSPVSPIRPSIVTNILTAPISTIKIKDIQTAPKVENITPVSIQVSPQMKSTIVVAPKSSMPTLSTQSPEGKGSVIKLLLSSPAQSTNTLVSTSTVTKQLPSKPFTVSKKKSKSKDKASSQEESSKIKQGLEMAQHLQAQQGMSSLKQPLNINTSMIKAEVVSDEGLNMSYVQGARDSGNITAEVKLEGLPPTASIPAPKETKLKHSKKSAVKDESVFLAPPLPSPNVIHVGPMNMGLETKHEADAPTKKKKTTSKGEIAKQREKDRLNMDEEMMDDEYGLDMSEIELGEPGEDSFMDIDNDDSLIMPDDDLVGLKSGKALKKKLGKAGMKGSIQLGDIPDSDLVMDFAKMKAYKSEEKKKKKQLKGVVIESEKASSKKKRAPTAYMLWCNVNRPRVVADNPGIDFSSISKTLGEMWSTLSEKDKMLWKRKAKKAAGKGSTLITTGRVPKTAISQSTSNMSRQGHLVTQRAVGPQTNAAMIAAKQAKISFEDGGTVKGFSADPVDVAAHLKIVGESLSIIGMRLQEHRGLIAVQGSLSVLLDSMLCAVAPLMCLTAVLPETNGLPHQTHMKNLDNIAYIMPGL